jgi:putative ABC transport system ATP-binding protein
MSGSPPSGPVIEARDLRKTYGKGVRPALDGVTLEVAAGEFVAVLGPSGCGKSTLLGIVGCLDRSFEGSLSLFGQNTRTMSDAEQARLRGRRIGFVFQAFHLLGHLDARENVLAPTLFAGDRKRREDLRARADQLLADVGLGGRGDDMPSTMSGGERQRLAIARALLMEPELLLCDEPTGNLDLVTGRQVTEIFRRLHEEGLTIVAVTHEEQLAAAASRIVRLSGGRIEGEESPESLREALENGAVQAGEAP